MLNDESTKEAYAWLSAHFKLVADHVPNREDQIHIDHRTRTDIHNEYSAVMSLRGKTPISLNRFRKLWNKCFDHVKARGWKQVTGKCGTCAMLNDLRSKAKGAPEREALTRLAYFHRTMFMAERRAYYDRREEAMSEPDKYMSTIADGMAQVHNNVPHYASNSDAGKVYVSTHLQGIINHGRNTFKIYRYLGHVGKGANVAIFSWLMELEKEYREKQRLPSTIYHQVDGGPENATVVMLAVAELLVHRGLTDKIVITRLPVGHTHEVSRSVKLLNHLHYIHSTYPR
jgi:hypothetical protein